MDDTLARMWHDVLGRIAGPLSMRFVLQPMIATFFAVRDRIADAHGGRPAVFMDDPHRLLGGARWD